MRISGSLVTCGRCGKPRGVRHTCVTQATSKWRVTRTRLKPRVSLTCSKCGKPLGSPLTHTCRVRTDWRGRAAQAERARRKAASAKRRAAERARRKAWQDKRRALERERRKAWKDKQRAAYQAKLDAARKRSASQTHDRTRHEPHACADENCHRYPCRIWREAFEAGRLQGHEEGFAKGYTDGYGHGYPDGIRDCPLPHQG